MEIEVRRFMAQIAATLRALTQRPRVERHQDEAFAREAAARVEVDIQRAEAELQREHLHAILMNLPASVAITTGPDHTFTLVNDVYQRIAGPHRQLLGRRLRDAIYECEEAGNVAMLDRVYRTGEAFVHKEFMVELDSNGTGERSGVFVNLCIQPLPDVHGEIEGLITLAVDITDQVKARAAVRESEERLQLALRAADVGTWRVDLETSLTTRDANLNRILGLPPIESTTPLADLAERVHPEDLPRVMESMKQAALDRGTYDEELRIVRPDGSVRWLRDRGQVICGPDGEPDYMTGAAADITEKKEAQRERDELLSRERAAREAAERLNRFKDEFLATVSHELRTPLTAILGWARIIQSQRLEADPIRKGIDIIERNARAQVQIVEDILDASAIITGKVRIRRRPTSVRAFIDAALETVRPAAEARGVALAAEYEHGLGAMAGDAERLQQVIWNLLSNGVKFTPRGGSVRVRAERADSEIVISISDTGKGIHPDFLPFVFDRFRQEDSSTSRLHGGLGLGLAIVRHLVETHGGSVEARSDGEGRGTTIVLRLPGRGDDAAIDGTRWPGASPPVTAAAEAQAPRSLEGVRVLVVDDELDARELLQAILDHAGASVTLAGSVREAMTALREQPPDVLVSDLGMPGEDGYALIRSVRSLGPDDPASGLPAIALTAYVHSDDRRRALASGFQMHVPKPIEPSRLVAVIAQLLGRTSPGAQRRSAV